MKTASKRLHVVGLVVAAILLGITTAHAVPSLGVGSDYGYVNGTDAYQLYWNKTPLAGPSDQDGFAVGASGSALHLWSNILDADIYILTTADVGTGNSITFNGLSNIYTDTGTFRSYDPTPYYGINMGKVDSSWSALTSPPFNPGPFFFKDVTVNYIGSLSEDQWIFAAADTNGLLGLQAKATKVYNESNGVADIQTEGGEYWVETNGLGALQYSKTKTGSPGNWVWVDPDTSVTYDADEFTNYGGDDSSPKTTSARGWKVPEPGTLMLLGSGLIGLAVVRRRKRRG